MEVPAMKIVEEAPYRFRIEPEGPMRVPGVVFVSRERYT
jgi:tRNA-splicing ligase RtcB